LELEVQVTWFREYGVLGFESTRYINRGYGHVVSHYPFVVQQGLTHMYIWTVAQFSQALTNGARSLGQKDKPISNG